jgi:hypothetical protein
MAIWMRIKPMPKRYKGQGLITQGKMKGLVFLFVANLMAGRVYHFISALEIPNRDKTISNTKIIPDFQISEPEELSSLHRSKLQVKPKFFLKFSKNIFFYPLHL